MKEEAKPQPGRQFPAQAAQAAQQPGRQFPAQAAQAAQQPGSAAPLYAAPRAPVVPSMKRRAFCHDYRKPGCYMITIVVRGRFPIFGSVAGTPQDTRMDLSNFGLRVLHEAFPAVTAAYPMVAFPKICMMPDHIHFIVRVSDDLPHGRYLGSVIGTFKAACNRLAKAMAVMAITPGMGIFEKGYNDSLRLDPERLPNWIRYLDDNPRRLLLKRLHPDLFAKVYDANVIGYRLQMCGNRFLLDIPEKAAVVVHRAWSADRLAYESDRWLRLGAGGGVLVSAAYSKQEKVVMRRAMDLGHRIIFIKDCGFNHYYKPAGAAFDACAAGRLLELSPFPFRTKSPEISRPLCLMLNSIAENIARLTGGAGSAP